MNKLIRKHLLNGLILFRLFVLLTLMVVFVSCAVTPEFTRKHVASKGTLIISAKRPLVASCISQELKQATKATSSSLYKVIESEESVILMSGDITVRIYDLEDSVGGTMVTLFYSSSFKNETLSIIDNCRRQLESPKSMPQSSGN